MKTLKQIIEELHKPISWDGSYQNHLRERAADVIRQYIRELGSFKQLQKENSRLRYRLKIARLERDAARVALSEQNFEELVKELDERVEGLRKLKEKRAQLRKSI